MKNSNADNVNREADAERARLQYESNIGSVNTTIAKTTAELEQSKAALKQSMALGDSLRAQLGLVSTGRKRGCRLGRE